MAAAVWLHVMRQTEEFLYVNEIFRKFKTFEIPLFNEYVSMSHHVTEPLPVVERSLTAAL